MAPREGQTGGGAGQGQEEVRQGEGGGAEDDRKGEGA